MAIASIKVFDENIESHREIIRKIRKKNKFLLRVIYTPVWQHDL